ncbi:type I DNA topoisomerase [bacterium]|nr:type I DNA topoisomerase [bacterium]
MNLVIVESPSKTKTIKEFLGKDYEVTATMGHIRDIANTGLYNLGLDFENNYKPIFEIIPHQHKTVDSLNKYVAKADKIFLATDPDREGEAISWHLKEVLNTGNKPVKRIEFNEITEPAILEAINNPRDIDMNLYHSQETRKIMDRIIGYRLTGVLKKATGINSNTAGRVQSATLRIIVDKQKDIDAFIPEKFYEIEVQFRHFKAKLTDPLHPTKPLILKDEEEANKIIASLNNEYIVKEIKFGERVEKAPLPFTTSTLTQAALNRYSMSAKKTSRIAQELYEGIEVNGKHIAFITYMRTDSTRLSDVFKRSLAGYIKTVYGPDDLGYAHTFNNGKIQDAHEAIRPVSLNQTPEKVEKYLNKDQFNLYKLIFTQTVASMMKDAFFETKTVYLENNNHLFSVTFEKPISRGFRKVKEKGDDEPKYYFNHEVSETMKPTHDPKILFKETEGPKPFTEATIIKEMEARGIGRPSTYSSTIENLKTKHYIEIHKKSIIPTKNGIASVAFLEKNFDSIINVNYTASMEKELDDIATGTADEFSTVDSFYKTFNEIYDKVGSLTIPTGEVCPICGSSMVYKGNTKGIFEACGNYPSCKYIKKAEKEESNENAEIKIECPECHKGFLVPRIAKKGKHKGKTFYGCSNFPDCTFVISDLKGFTKK